MARSRCVISALHRFANGRRRDWRRKKPLDTNKPHTRVLWLISDIYLDGAISEVATRRSEFAAILNTEGIDGLIAVLNRKADILTATTAEAS
jgi:hypothetical protein